MGNTANLNLPYPENTDPLANMAAAMQALANAVDALTGLRNGATITKLGKMFLQTGQQSVVLTTANAAASIHVTFAQAFSAAPTVQATSMDADIVASVKNVTATGFDLWVYRPAGAVNWTNSSQWLAIGVK